MEDFLQAENFFGEIELKNCIEVCSMLGGSYLTS